MPVGNQIAATRLNRLRFRIKAACSLSKLFSSQKLQPSARQPSWSGTESGKLHNLHHFQIRSFVPQLFATPCFPRNATITRAVVTVLRSLRFLSHALNESPGLQSTSPSGDLGPPRELRAISATPRFRVKIDGLDPRATSHLGDSLQISSPHERRCQSVRVLHSLLEPNHSEAELQMYTKFAIPRNLPYLCLTLDLTQLF
jgi:hypothetical protein